MNTHKVSVVIPAYNQANYLAQAVQSILAQTYANLEVIVVNDASTDNTDEVIRQFTDSRLRYLRHKENRYAAAARNTGIRAANGELIAFMDADDVAHPKRIEAQVSFLEKNPDIGLTYCNRLEIDSTGLPLSFVKAPATVTLANLVMGYPFAPSEVVLWKYWVNRVNLFDESYVFHGEDPDFFMRLALDGCRMAGTDAVLNSRRLHAGRKLRNLAKILAGDIRAFESALADPRCPPEAVSIRRMALAKEHLAWAYVAFAQNETALGQGLVRKALGFDPTLVTVKTREFPRQLAMTSIRDGGDHAPTLRAVLKQFPAEVEWVLDYTEWAVAYGYLARGARELLWGRAASGAANFERASQMGARPDGEFYQFLASQLLSYDAEVGHTAADTMLDNLLRQLATFTSNSSVRTLRGRFAVNRAFRGYAESEYRRVPLNVMQAVLCDPRYLANRGVLAIFVRSLTNMLGSTPRNVGAGHSL